MPCRTAVPTRVPLVPVSVLLVPLLLLGAICGSLPARAAETPESLRLEDALALAFRNNPELAIHRADLTAARGEVIAARVYPYNPELEVEGADRRGPDGSVTDRGLSLAQELELAGQRSKRRAAAGDALEAARDLYRRRRAELAARVERLFARAVAARERLGVARTDAELTRRLVELESRRLEAGAGNQLDLNLARAVAGRAERALALAEAAGRNTRAELAEQIGLDPATAPEAAGTFPDAPPSPASLDELAARALEHRADLRAAKRQVEASRRRVELQRSLAKPNLLLRGFAAHEEGDDLTGVSLRVAVPLFDRNQGGIARAGATLDRTTAEVYALEQSVRREVAAAHARYRSAARALGAFDRLVVGTLEESLTLLDRAFESGEVGITDVLVQRRELVEARREHVDAAAAAWLARIELDLATGDTRVPPAETTDTKKVEVGHVR
jgi:cobalt-zinc-cadmium efflux system outer membrane protein